MAYGYRPLMQPRPMPQQMPQQPGVNPDDPDGFDAMSDEELAYQAKLHGMTDAELGIDPLQLDQPQEPQMPGGYGRTILEGLGGLEQQNYGRPQNFGEGLLSGLGQGLGRAGTKATQERAKFEEKALERQAARDKGNREATDKYRERKAAAFKELNKTRSDERKDNREYNQKNPLATDEMIAAVPGLKRAGYKTGDRIPETVANALRLDQAELPKPEKPEKSLTQIQAEAAARARGIMSATGGKPPTMEQSKSRSYANQSRLAVDIATRGGLEGKIAKASLNYQMGLRAARPLQSTEQQSYSDAITQFALALNRLQSGATVSQSEFERVQNLYFVAPGDSKDPRILSQKQELRERVMRDMEEGGGNWYGNPSAKPNAQATGADAEDDQSAYQRYLEMNAQMGGQ